MIPLSYSQANIVAGALQADDPADYLIAKTYTFTDSIPGDRVVSAVAQVCADHPILLHTLAQADNDGRTPDSGGCDNDSTSPICNPDVCSGGEARSSHYGFRRTLTPLDVILDATHSQPSGSLDQQWRSGLVGVPLVRWTISRKPSANSTAIHSDHSTATCEDAPIHLPESESSPQSSTTIAGIVLTIEAHHVLLDGGAIALIEQSLANYLGPNESPELQQKSSTAGSGGDKNIQQQRGLGNAGASESSKRPNCMEGSSEAAIIAAHNSEKSRSDAARSSNIEAVKKALADLSPGTFGEVPTLEDSSIPTARRGVRLSRSSIEGEDYRTLMDSLTQEFLPIDTAVTAAAVALTAAEHHTTGIHVFHTVDPRFATPEFNVATCLVNTLWFPLQFPAFASVVDLARRCDRGLAAARRRRWLREEDVRRELVRHHMANGASVTLNVQRGRVYEDLRPFLQAEPDVTEIGPVESPTLVAIDDAARNRLDIELWAPASERGMAVVGGDFCTRVANYLRESALNPHVAAAELAGDWHLVEGGSTAPKQGHWAALSGFDQQRLEAQRPGVRGWLRRFAEANVPAGAIVLFDGGGFEGTELARAGFEYAKLEQAGLDGTEFARAGFEGTELEHAELEGSGSGVAIDLALAAHLNGCGYCPCRNAQEVEERAGILQDAGEVVVTVALDRRAEPLISVDGVSGNAFGEGDESGDGPVGDSPGAFSGEVPFKACSASVPPSGDSTAYILPTSGTTGKPKLVRITHANLAAFLAGARDRYGWRSDDVVAQCAEFTSDISVEEIFLSALVGARIVSLGSHVLRDPAALLEEAARYGVTVLDLPTSIWHALAADRGLIEQCREAGIRCIVVGGEPVNPAAVYAWNSVLGSVPVLSTYGPTEATVVATTTPLCETPSERESLAVAPGQGKESYGRNANIDRSNYAAPGAPSKSCSTLDRSNYAAPGALGEPLIEGSVAVAFGEVVLLGDAISPGYIGRRADTFGKVAVPAAYRSPHSSQCSSTERAGQSDSHPAQKTIPALATGDRVTWDETAGTWLFAGRRDEIVKVAGRRVDLFALRSTVELMPGIKDCHVAVLEGRLIVWVHSADADASTRARQEILSAGYPVSAVARVDRIPRDFRGRADRDFLVRHLGSAASSGHQTHDACASDQAIRLAEAWSQELHLQIGPDDSLIDLAVSSLDIMRILPITQALAGWNCSVRDILQQPTARELTARDLRTGELTARDLGAGELTARDLGAGELSAGFSRATGEQLSVSQRLSGKPTSTAPAPMPINSSTHDETDSRPAVLLLGATGSVGSAVLRTYLGERTRRVIIALRGGIPADEMWAEAFRSKHCEILTDLGDWAKDQSFIPEIMDRFRVDVVLNCVGVTSTMASRAELDAGNVDLPVWLAHLCRSRHAHLIHLSSTVVAEHYEKAEVTEDGQAHFEYAESKIAGEHALVNEPHVTVVRLPRVMPTVKGAQLDALLTITAACRAAGSYPEVDVVEEVVTVDQVAHALVEEVKRVGTSGSAAEKHRDGEPMGFVSSNHVTESDRDSEPTGFAASTPAGRANPAAELIVYRGKTVDYTTFLPRVAPKQRELLTWQRSIHALDRQSLGARVVDLIDEWVKLVHTFRRRPWATINAVALPYARVVQRGVGTSLTDEDLLALL